MRRGIAGAAVILGLLGIPASASADHHFMLIREVSPETSAGANNAFVELQMYSSGQSFVNGHFVSFYDPDGNNSPTTDFDHDVANGQNQRTVLIGDTAVAGADFTDSGISDDVDSAGGAVCFESTEPAFGTIDCVAWGSFSSGTAGDMNDEPVGNPVAPAGIPVGQSITRSIAPGCATLLESGDDTNDSATDFAVAAPSPRPNAVAPTEQSCGPGGGVDNNPPNTEITKGPKKKTGKHKAKFKFTSSEPGSSFECKLDGGGFKSCDSPEKVKGLDDGKHKFLVRATDNAGNTDPTPAKLRFKVV